MAKDYALRKLYSKEKVIFCGCDAISGLLIHYLLDELFGRNEYLILHRFQKNWKRNGNGLLMMIFLIRLFLKSGLTTEMRE